MYSASTLRDGMGLLDGVIPWQELMAKFFTYVISGFLSGNNTRLQVRTVA